MSRHRGAELPRRYGPQEESPCCPQSTLVSCLLDLTTYCHTATQDRDRSNTGIRVPVAVPLLVKRCDFAGNIVLHRQTTRSITRFVTHRLQIWFGENVQRVEEWPKNRSNLLIIGQKLAESEGFEPPDGLTRQRFSRPPHSTTLPTLRKGHAVRRG